MIIKLIKTRGESVYRVIGMNDQGKTFHKKFNSQREAMAWVDGRVNRLNLVWEIV